MFHGSAMTYTLDPDFSPREKRSIEDQLFDAVIRRYDTTRSNRALKIDSIILINVPRTFRWSGTLYDITTAKLGVVHQWIAGERTGGATLEPEPLNILHLLIQRAKAYQRPAEEYFVQQNVLDELRFRPKPGYVYLLRNTAKGINGALIFGIQQAAERVAAVAVPISELLQVSRADNRTSIR